MSDEEITMDTAREFCRRHRLSPAERDDLLLAQLLVLLEIKRELTKFANPPMMVPTEIRDYDLRPGRIRYVDRP